jgi:YhcH/YjgK/YiaL family protein
MILDVLENAHRYLALNRKFAKAFEFLLRQGLKELTAGKYEIDGDCIYAMVSKVPGRKKEDAQLETHKKFIDIQLVLSGTDGMGWKPSPSCKLPSGEYDQKADVQFFADEPDIWFSAKSGEFVIFFPEDAHMPLISSGEIHKVVVKVAVD